MEKTELRTALEPTRQHGKLRAAALLKAGAEVMAERGFEAATMAEIAARADAPIGSLYRFFPSKQILAEALIERYRELLRAAFEDVSDDPSEMSTNAFADALLSLFVNLRGETKAFIALLESHSNWSVRRAECHADILELISNKLTCRNPRLGAKAAEDMAVVLLQNIKTMKKLTEEHESGEDCAGAMAELREMTRLYLASKLANNSA